MPAGRDSNNAGLYERKYHDSKRGKRQCLLTPLLGETELFTNSSYVLRIRNLLKCILNASTEQLQLWNGRIRTKGHLKKPPRVEEVASLTGMRLALHGAIHRVV